MQTIDNRILQEIPNHLQYIYDIIHNKKRKNVEEEFHLYSKAYMQTTENINGYINLMHIQNANILTVIGSSDQIFEFILRGAKRVDGFDISMNAIMFYYLKEAALNSLTYEEYLNFFFVESNRFQKEKYEQIRKYLNNIAIPFWDIIFKQERNETLKVISYIITNNRSYLSQEKAQEKLSILTSYFSYERFQKIKENIHSCAINIYLSDVKELDRIESKYNYIILSNIFEYQKEYDLISFKQAINRYQSKLLDDGQIIVGYAYHNSQIENLQEYERILIPSRYPSWNYPTSPIKDSIFIKRKKL